ncbi:MAG: MGMT family protein [Chitinophagales bacterium]|nr:MGMT family protein [Chitinophagales bacterium]
MNSTKKGAKNELSAKQAAQYSFFENVWDVVRQIPKGRVTSYGAIAAYLGTPKAARTVGYAMNACHGLKPKVPAHRVVNRNGLLSGRHHFGSPHAMQYLLEKEKIAVANNQVIDFKSLFWDPCAELRA